MFVDYGKFHDIETPGKGLSRPAPHGSLGASPAPRYTSESRNAN